MEKFPNINQPEQEPAARNIPSKNNLLDRFNLQREEWVKERLATIRDGFKKLQEKDQAIVALTLFGSLVKGTTRPDSDVDGFLFIDADVLEEREKFERPDESRSVTFDIGSTNNPETFLEERYYDVYKPKIVESMTSTGKLSEEQIRDINIRPVSKAIIDKQMDSLNLALGRGQDIEPSKNLYALFHLSVGRGLDTYRQEVIERLESLGKNGEGIWKKIISKTEKMEQYFYEDTPIRYPRSLKEARERYKHETT